MNKLGNGFSVFPISWAEVRAISEESGRGFFERTVSTLA